MKALVLSVAVVFAAYGILVVVLVAYYAILTYVSRVEVEDVALFVVLPFQTETSLPTDFTVEWSRCAPEPIIVHEYRNGHPIRQDQFYSNRTDLHHYQLGIGDFSLTLRNPCFRDIGTYICTVYKNREIHAQKVVHLKFKESWWFLRREY